jgi:hypothetical protein
MEDSQEDGIPVEAGVIDIETYRQAKPYLKLDFVEEEILDTLAYVNTCIDDAELKSLQVVKFSESVINGKKMLIEQKLNLLKLLASIPEQKIKIKKLDENSDGKIADITSLFRS